MTREEVADAQRRRLLEAMAEVVAERGYAKTSVTQVTKAARVSTETFYELFADKEACFLAAYVECVAEIQETMLTALATAEGDLRERFTTSLDAYFQLLDERRALARTFLVEVYAAGPAALERRAAQQESFVALLVGVLQAETDRERFACRALVATISTLLTTVVSTGRFEELPQLRDDIIDLFVEGLARR